MKAKEHLARHRERLEQGATEQDSMGALFMELINDAIAVAIQRSGRPKPHDGILRVALKEQDSKWRKIASEMGWSPVGFEAVLASKGLRI